MNSGYTVFTDWGQLWAMMQNVNYHDEGGCLIHKNYGEKWTFGV